MDKEILKQHFAKIGAILEIEVAPTGRRFQQYRPGFDFLMVDFWLDIIRHKRNELFKLTIREDVQDDLAFLAIDIQPEQRHLLLLLRRLAVDADRRKEKFLCGHDERHWFVATVPDASGVTNVAAAMEALKPEAAIQLQRRYGVKPKNRNRRRNAGFIRQGEWFFLPRPEFELTNPHLILRNEPIRRGRSKPHIVEQLYRTGGVTVYVNFRYPNGLTEDQYRQLIKRDPSARKLNWQVMRRNPRVYARGKVRHPDHKTIVLPFWHQVDLSGESITLNVTFLD